jgi:hypothetical protein
LKDIKGVFAMSLQDAGRIESFVHEESVTEAATKCIRASAEVKNNVGIAWLGHVGTESTNCDKV